MSNPVKPGPSPLDRFRELRRKAMECDDGDELIRIGIAMDKAWDAMSDEERALAGELPVNGEPN